MKLPLVGVFRTSRVKRHDLPKVGRPQSLPTMGVRRKSVVRSASWDANVARPPALGDPRRLALPMKVSQIGTRAQEDVMVRGVVVWDSVAAC